MDDISLALAAYRRSLPAASVLTAQEDITECFPLSPVLHYYQDVGKHFVAQNVLRELENIQSLLSDAIPDNSHKGILWHFLEMALDKHLGYYDYNTYIGTHLLNSIAIDSSLPFNAYLSARVSHLILLLCDVGLFECQTFLSVEHRLPDYLTSPQNRKKRILHILRAAHAYGELAGYLDLPGRLADSTRPFLSDQSNIDTHNLMEISHIFENVMAQMPGPLQTICAITMQPVWTVHDEYLFIRVLQCFEIIFSIVVKGFLTCQNLIQQEDFARCSPIMQTLNALFQRNSMLFRVLTSMPRETFSLFRVYTEGASAIQSEQYKLIEALAARPDPTRLQSAAFTSVPTVKKSYEDGKIVSLEELLLPRMDWQNTDFRALMQSIMQFDEAFVQWKKIHTNIAVKMLGSQPGTGYTLGTPYLREFAERRLFPFLQRWEDRLVAQ